jgi:hypothetical protein
MTGVESMLRRMFEGRTRRWSIIIVNGVLALALGLPAVDEYFALRHRKSELATQLDQAREQVQRTEDLQQRATLVAQALSTVKSRAVSDENTQAYRQKVVQLIRESGCQLRKLSMENTAIRDWRQDDHPLVRPKSQRGGGTKEESAKYRLRTQAVSLSISGTLSDVRKFIKSLHAEGKLMHTTQLAIRPGGRDRDNVVMELQFMLFGLERNGAASADVLLSSA